MNATSSLWWPLLVTLLIVITILGLAWWMKHAGLTPIAQLQGRFKILARCALGPREQLVIVNIDEHCLLLGVTAHSIQLLDRFEGPITENAPSPSVPPSFSSLLAKFKSNTKEKA